MGDGHTCSTIAVVEFSTAPGQHSSSGPHTSSELPYVHQAVRHPDPAAGVHIRLMVTRGLKPTPYQNPNTTIGKPTIVIVPEYKVRYGC
mgnify:CR=1 FL=1